MTQRSRFIGRERELEFLNERYKSSGGQLVVLYGRRRVGKTETLKQFCAGKPHVFFSCTQTTDRAQLARFSARLFQEDIPAKRYITEFTDWERALAAIADLPFGEHKRLVVIDEFPYMCQANGSIPSVLQNLWDAELREKNVMIILCGSSMSFIEKELLAEKNPLYGRATGIYKMKEMGFYDAAKFFPGYSAADKITAYAVLGGIPHYLNQFDPDITLEENIKKNILTKGCILYSEVEFMLHQELRETAVYNSVIEAVANGATKLNEISQRSLIDSTSKTSTYLKNLVELGIITREFSVDTAAKEKSKSNRGTYRLTDNFFRFWYAYAFNNFSQLEDGDVDGVYEYVVKPGLHEFAAFTFEDVCREFVRLLQRRNELPFRYVNMGRWTGKTTVRDSNALMNRKNASEASAPGAADVPLRTAETEIDLLAIAPGAEAYLLGECKFKRSPFSYSEYLDTKAKLTPYKKNSRFYYALFSESGFDSKIREEAEACDNIMLYGLEDIVEADHK